MKTKITTATAICAVIFHLLGCNEKVDLPEQDESQYRQLYMPLAVNNPQVYTIPVAEEPHGIIYGANIGGFGYPENDIKINFNVEPSSLADYNEANRTDYELLPAGSYSLSASEAWIKKGELATAPLSVHVHTMGENALTMFKTYLLPISISANHKINTSLKTTYYLITSEPDIADYPDYDRSNWQIIDFSSEEANGEGPNNGRAIFVLDNDIQSFWHSRWQGASPNPPHHLTVDMGEVKELHGINVISRQLSGASGKPHEVVIETSMDNTTWEEAAQLTLDGTNNMQKKWLPNFVEARYFRFVIVTSYNSSHAHLAELGAF